MVKKIALLVLLLLIPFFSLYANIYIGFSAGYALNQMETITPWKMTEYGPSHGVDIALKLEYAPLSFLSLNTGIRYVNKGFSYTEYSKSLDDEPELIASYDEMHHYLELPLTLNFSLPVSDIVSLYLGGGGFIGYWLLSNVRSVKESEILNPDEGIIEFSDADNRFEAGLIALAGCSIKIREDIFLLAEFNYLASLSSETKDTQRDTYHRYNDTFSFSFGSKFKIGGAR